VFDILGESGMDPKRLELELTESVLMTGAESTASALQALRKNRIQVALDDFGTGFSSLSYLQKFPVDCLKIDQSFVRQISTQEGDGALVTAIIQMAHSLELRVIAEGVETKDELQFIKDRGCDEGQGYYFSRPLTSSGFAERLAEQDRTMATSCSPPFQSRSQACSTQSFGTSPEGAGEGNAKLPAIQGLAARQGR
jgi:EAL domain-containing protein (putative c-di-GMP-specific phosphodiesterase class I)